MNNKLKNYSTQPDPEVWNKIRKTLRRQEFRRQAIGGTFGTVIAVAAIVTVVLWPYDTKTTVSEPAQTQVAQVSEMPSEASPVVNELTAEVAEVQAQQQPAMVSNAPRQAKAEENNQESSAPVVVPTATSTTVSQPQVAPVVENRPVETVRPAVTSRPTAKVEPTTSKAVAQPAEVETTVAENPPATPAVKNPINNEIIEDTILWIPNAFAPASDDYDVASFRARLNKTEVSILNYRITIFNRQGHQVFHSSDINQAWDGTYKGRALPQGGYVYVIYYVDKDGLTHQRKGTVALIR